MQPLKIQKSFALLVFFFTSTRDQHAMFKCRHYADPQSGNTSSQPFNVTVNPTGASKMAKYISVLKEISFLFCFVLCLQCSSYATSTRTWWRMKS